MVIAQCLGDWKRPQRDTAHGKEGSGLYSKTGKQATPSQTTCALTLRTRGSGSQHAEARRAYHRPALHITFKHPLRFRSKEKLTAGAHSRREREVRRQRQEQQSANRQGRSGGRNN